MKVNLHCRNFDQSVKDAIIGMVGYGLAKLLPNRERLLNNVEIDVHMRRHADGGGAEETGYGGSTMCPSPGGDGEG